MLFYILAGQEGKRFLNKTSFFRVADGIYRNGKHFYYRPRTPDGRRTWRALDAATLKAARIAYARVSGKADGTLTVGEAVEVYLAADCPQRNRQPRQGRQLDLEKGRCRTLLEYWRKFPCSSITTAALDDFADWRIEKGRGARAAELDIVCLKNALRWAARRGLLATNPFDTIKTTGYRTTVRHCREVAPRSGDELHDLAAHLFDEPRSVVLGWLTLLTAMVGGRISEMLSLRMDAKAGEPGNISDGVLWLRRAKKGSHPFLKIHPALEQCLNHFFSWRKIISLRSASSPWWFPGRTRGEPISEQSLSHALRRAGKLLVRQPRTAHGLRSFYVTCRRSEGVSDADIALEVGQVSGGREIVRTYGEASPVKVGWLPTKGEPAWQHLTKSQKVELYHFYTTAFPFGPVSETSQNAVSANEYSI